MKYFDEEEFNSTIEKFNESISIFDIDNPDLFEKCITVVTDRWMESESALRKEELDRTQKAVSRRIELEEKADDLEKELQNLRNEVVSQQEELNAFKKEAEEARNSRNNNNNSYDSSDDYGNTYGNDSDSDYNTDSSNNSNSSNDSDSNSSNGNAITNDDGSSGRNGLIGSLLNKDN